MKTWADASREGTTAFNLHPHPHTCELFLTGFCLSFSLLSKEREFMTGSSIPQRKRRGTRSRHEFQSWCLCCFLFMSFPSFYFFCLPKQFIEDLGTGLSARDTVMCKDRYGPCPHGAYSLSAERNINQVMSQIYIYKWKYREQREQLRENPDLGCRGHRTGFPEGRIVDLSSKVEGW